MILRTFPVQQPTIITSDLFAPFAVCRTRHQPRLDIIRFRSTSDRWRLTKISSTCDAGSACHRKVYVKWRTIIIHVFSIRDVDMFLVTRYARVFTVLRIHRTIGQLTAKIGHGLVLTWHMSSALILRMELHFFFYMGCGKLFFPKRFRAFKSQRFSPACNTLKTIESVCCWFCSDLPVDCLYLFDASLIHAVLLKQMTYVI